MRQQPMEANASRAAICTLNPDKREAGAMPEAAETLSEFAAEPGIRGAYGRSANLRVQKE